MISTTEFVHAEDVDMTDTLRGQFFRLYVALLYHQGGPPLSEESNGDPYHDGSAEMVDNFLFYVLHPLNLLAHLAELPEDEMRAIRERAEALGPPKAPRPRQTTIDRLRAGLESGGVDLTGVSDNDMLAALRNGHGSDSWGVRIARYQGAATRIREHAEAFNRSISEARAEGLHVDVRLRNHPLLAQKVVHVEAMLPIEPEEDDG